MTTATLCRTLFNVSHHNNVRKMKNVSLVRLQRRTSTRLGCTRTSVSKPFVWLSVSRRTASNVMFPNLFCSIPHLSFLKWYASSLMTSSSTIPCGVTRGCSLMWFSLILSFLHSLWAHYLCQSCSLCIFMPLIIFSLLRPSIHFSILSLSLL